MEVEVCDDLQVRVAVDCSEAVEGGRVRAPWVAWTGWTRYGVVDTRQGGWWWWSGLCVHLVTGWAIVSIADWRES